MRPLNILGICGSLRTGSFNHAALRAAGQLMPAGMQLEIIDLRGIPLYDQDVQDAGWPPAVMALRERILRADALLIASPEYNFSISGVLKNTIDWLSRTSPQPFKDKPVAIVSATTGPVGGARHQYELRKVLGCLEALVLHKPEVFIGMSAGKFDAATGELTDAATRKVLGDQMVALEQWTRRLAVAA